MGNGKKLLLTVLMISSLLLVSRGDCTASYQEYGKLGITLKESEYLYDSIPNQFDNSLLLDYNLQINEGNLIGCFKLSVNYSQNQDGLFFSLAKGYVTYQNEFLSFELGKNRVLNGVGYAWNPADIMNPKKSPLYRDEEKRSDEGVFFTSLSYYGFLNSLAYEVRGIMLPAADRRQSKGVLSTKLAWQSLETLFLVGFEKDEQPVYAGTGRFSCTELPFTLYGEFRNYEMKTDWKYLLGIQYNPSFTVFGGNIQAQLEYFRNENSYRHDVVDYYAYYPGETPVLGELYENYAYVGLTYYSLGLITSCGVIKNLDQDGSGMINYLLTYPLNNESTISLGGYLPFGRDVDEFPYFIDRNYEIYLTLSIAFGD